MTSVGVTTRVNRTFTLPTAHRRPLVIDEVTGIKILPYRLICFIRLMEIKNCFERMSVDELVGLQKKVKKCEFAVNRIWHIIEFMSAANVPHTCCIEQISSSHL